MGINLHVKKFSRTVLKIAPIKFGFATDLRSVVISRSMRFALLFGLLLASVNSFAVSIPIVNHSLEGPTLGGGSFFYSPTQMPGWSWTTTGRPDRGIWNTTTAGKDGFNIAFAYRNNAFAQQLSETVSANTTYTLDHLIGRSGGSSRGTAELWAGGTLANGVVTGGTLLVSQTTQVNKSEMTPLTLVFTSPISGSVIGQQLTVRFAGTTMTGESYVSFDNVRLSAEPVPEPATMLALNAGLVALLRRRKA